MPRTWAIPAFPAPESHLSRMARRVTLDITERAALDALADVKARIAELRGLGYAVAIDNLGAGYAGLSSFAQLEPQVVKLDMSLIRGLDASRTKTRLVRSLYEAFRDLDILVITRGVETPEERDALAALGGDLMQGYLFARPGRPFPEDQLAGGLSSMTSRAGRTGRTGRTAPRSDRRIRRTAPES